MANRVILVQTAPDKGATEMTQTIQTPNEKYVVRILGKSTYEADTVQAAIASLPGKHPLAQIYAPGAYMADLPQTSLIDVPKQLRKRGVEVGIPATPTTPREGDIVEVLHLGNPQNSGGGLMQIVTRKQMLVVAIVANRAMKQGGQDSYQEFTSDPAGLVMAALVDIA